MSGSRATISAIENALSDSCFMAELNDASTISSCAVKAAPTRSLACISEIAATATMRRLRKVQTTTNWDFSVLSILRHRASFGEA